MVISDMYIMCISQKDAFNKADTTYSVSCGSLPITDNMLLFNDEKENIFVQNLRGMWYSFEPNARNDGDYTEEWFDLACQCKQRDKVKVLEGKAKIVLNILNDYLDSSPSGYSVVLFRLEPGPNAKEIIKGVFNKKRFIKMLFENKLDYNAAYVIKNV